MKEPEAHPGLYSRWRDREREKSKLAETCADKSIRTWKENTSFIQTTAFRKTFTVPVFNVGIIQKYTYKNITAQL